MIRGFDAASYQGAFDAERASRDGYAFCILKATQGTSYVNPYYRTQAAKVRASGMLLGHYHFTEFGSADAEAAHFISTVEAAGHVTTGELFALDCEDRYDDAGNLIPAPADCYPLVLDVALRVYRAFGAYPLIYSSQSFIDAHNLSHLANNNLGLWLAAWQSADPTPVPQWPFVAFWQYADKGSVDGINGPVDLDFFNGPLARLHLYGVK